ncbi:MAG: sigma-70 family RNA polymerase sigma factor [Oscillospiraceae bacterium]|nr:sigma-70 family RNA polymerase sigma factor [Oscillospiraceae bacterium]
MESLFRLYKDDVYRLALSYTRSTQEAQDVCQTVFVKLMEQSNIAAGKEKAWLMRVTVNQCRNLLRSRWWKTTVPLDDTLPEMRTRHREVYYAVMSLQPKYRVVVYLHYYEQYTTTEIADLLKISQTAVTTRLNRARQMLKAQLMEVNV